MTAQARETVGEVAARSLAATRVFEDQGIDFCCGGSKAFDDACREKQLDPAQVRSEIEAAMERENAEARERQDWSSAPLGDLIEHILARHHAYLRAELPRLAAWLAAVRVAHGERDGEMLGDLDSVFSALRDELEMHMRKEEMILFPAIRHSEGWIGQPISVMEHEHESAGHALAELRRITGEFRTPEHACNTYRALYAGLEALERDLHVHIHLENNILFPRAMGEMNRGRGC